MFGSRRLAKRSIIGTRVSAPWQDGRFNPGVIVNTEVQNSRTTYEIRFLNGDRKEVSGKDIIAPGFRSITSLRMKQGQIIFVTHNGREVSGEVISHDVDIDEVRLVLSQQAPPGENTEMIRKLEECRLIESRKSARLQDQDTDYSKIIDMHPEPKKRAVSSVIDVPAKSRRRLLSVDMMGEDGDDETGIDEGDYDAMEIMDERMAAMVLTSLSCSPVSPKFPASFYENAIGTHPSPPRGTSWNERHHTGNRQRSFSESHLSTSAASSGVVSNKSESPDPTHSPPLGSSSEAASVATPVFGSYVDEGIDLDSNDVTSGETARKRRRSSTRTVYQCSWPGCTVVEGSEQTIEKHVRETHLGPRQPHSSDSDMSDHEEEFYYAEVEVEDRTQSYETVYKPPTAIHDHDYQKKERPITFHNSRPGTSGAISIPIPHVKRSLSWQSNIGLSTSMSPPARFGKYLPTFLSSSTPSKTAILISPQRHSPLHKRSRSDVKKCRKIYGMENRDMWCTQCKWKKACSRFTD